MLIGLTHWFRVQNRQILANNTYSSSTNLMTILLIILICFIYAVSNESNLNYSSSSQTLNKTGAVLYTNAYQSNYISLKVSIQPLLIVHKYLQKDPSSNKVTFRFNIQPKNQVFQTQIFSLRLSNMIQVLWNSYTLGSLKAYKVQNGLQKNGLFAIEFLYQKEWKNVQININLANSNLPQFIVSGAGSTLSLYSTTTILPQTSDNNLVMYSDNYGLFDITKYCSLCLVGLIWLYWLAGLFYGKIVVIDFIIVNQLILLCSMTSGQLSPGFSGMMLQIFTFYTFTGLFSPDYEERPIYQNISSKLIAGNISTNVLQNLSMWLFLTAIILLIALISKLYLRFYNSKNFIFNYISKYIFEEYLLYSLLPFILSGSISTVLCFKNLILGTLTTSIVNILIIVFFNIVVIAMIILGKMKPQIFGQFVTHFLRFDISQYFYLLVLLYVTIIGYLFTLTFNTDFVKFAPVLVILIFISIIAFNIYKSPYLSSRHHYRVYLLYGTGILLAGLILIQNIVATKGFKQYLPVIIIILELILSLITGYYLFLSIKLDGKPKIDSFLEQYRQKKVSIQTGQIKDTQYQLPILLRLNNSTVNYYQKQSRILQNLNKNTLPETGNYQEEYQNLRKQLNNDQNQKNNFEEIYPSCNQENKKEIEKVIHSKLMKMSLKCHLINDNFQNYDSNRSFLGEQEQKFTFEYHNKINIIINQLKQKDKKNQLDHARENLENKKNLEKFPEELIADYKIQNFFAERQKQIKIEREQKQRIIKEKNRYFSRNPVSPTDQIKQISYYSWVKQIQAEDEQIQKAKEQQSEQNQQSIQNKQ